jgi:hypothetical protein
MFKLDLTAGYFNMLVRRSMRRFFGSTFEGLHTEAAAAPFAFRSSARWMHKLTRTLCARYRLQGMTVITYLDDKLYAKPGFVPTVRQRNAVVPHGERLGFRYNSKSHPLPRRSIDFPWYHRPPSRSNPFLPHPRPQAPTLRHVRHRPSPIPLVANAQTRQTRRHAHLLLPRCAHRSLMVTPPLSFHVPAVRREQVRGRRPTRLGRLPSRHTRRRRRDQRGDRHLQPAQTAFFWKAYLSIKQPLTAHDPIHPQVSSRHVAQRHRLPHLVPRRGDPPARPPRPAVHPHRRCIRCRRRIYPPAARRPGLVLIAIEYCAATGTAVLEFLLTHIDNPHAVGVLLDVLPAAAVLTHIPPHLRHRVLFIQCVLERFADETVIGAAITHK